MKINVAKIPFTGLSYRVTTSRWSKPPVDTKTKAAI